MRLSFVFLLLMLLLVQICSHAQVPDDLPSKGIKALWLFSGNANDESGQEHHGKVHGATLTQDRFGNKNNAYRFNGISDFISTNYEGVLGSHARAVSFWARSETLKNTAAITWGANKYFPNDGCRFACAFNYMQPGATVDVSDAGLTFEAISNVYDGKWHHYVFQFFVPIVKKVEVYQDGVLLTHEAHRFYIDKYINTLKKNDVTIGGLPDLNSYFPGDLDDIAIYDRGLSLQEIQALYNAPDPDKTSILMRRLIIFFAIVVLLALIILFIRQWLKRLIKKEKEQLILRNNWYEQENRMLKAQMDPHFIFNSLNTIQQLILVHDYEKSQQYLYKFSRLLRKMLESNVKESISLEEELELIESYLEIESLRFEDVFNYNINLPKGVELSGIHIPHFLIQPLIENAVWHALLPKTGYKHIDITFSQIDNDTLRCVIDDNGVGRKHQDEKADTKKKKSLAINFILQRLSLMSKIRNVPYELVIEDKVNANGESEGTKVIITLPIIINL